MIPATTNDVGLILYGILFGIFLSGVIVNAWRFIEADDDE